MGYQITGKFPTGNNALGILSVKGNKREPVPAAIITAWNSTIVTGYEQLAARLNKAFKNGIEN